MECLSFWQENAWSVMHNVEKWKEMTCDFR